MRIFVKGRGCNCFRVGQAVMAGPHRCGGAWPLPHPAAAHCREEDHRLPPHSGAGGKDGEPGVGPPERGHKQVVGRARRQDGH